MDCRRASDRGLALTTMRHLLLVTRDFPPTSHVSVERAMKLVKYLPEFGWHPTVLTGEKGSFGLPADPGLLDQVAGAEVIRAPAPEFSHFYAGRGAGGGPSNGRRGARKPGLLHPKTWLVPDSQVLWYPFAVRAALRDTGARRWNAVVSTCFPPTALLIGHSVAGHLRLPHVVDFRDGWTRYHSAPSRPLPLARLEGKLEGRVIRAAAAVVTVDPAVVAPVLDRIPPADRPPLQMIPNGYDEDDFAGIAPAELPRFSIVHTGQLRRAPVPLWQALARAIDDRPALRGRLHFWQIGFVSPDAHPGLVEAPEGVAVHHVPPVTQRRAISYMLGADLLLVEEYGTVMPSKTLQYLRAGRPILALVEGGGVIRDVLRDIPRAHLVGRDKVPRAGRVVAALSAEPRCQAGERPTEAVAAYSRREIARRFAAVVDAACVGRVTGRPV